MMNLQSLLGVPYVTLGRDIAKDGGLDCWGLVRVVYQEIGKGLLPEYLIDEKELKSAMFEQETSSSTWEQIAKPEAFCIALFRLNDGGWHCGVVLPDKRRFIHCRKPRVMIERLDDATWHKLLKGYYRYAG